MDRPHLSGLPRIFPSFSLFHLQLQLLLFFSSHLISSHPVNTRGSYILCIKSYDYTCPFSLSTSVFPYFTYYYYYYYRLQLNSTWLPSNRNSVILRRSRCVTLSLGPSHWPCRNLRDLVVCVAFASTAFAHPERKGRGSLTLSPCFGEIGLAFLC